LICTDWPITSTRSSRRLISSIAASGIGAPGTSTQPTREYGTG
jgi:hypothetical protein